MDVGILSKTFTWQTQTRRYTTAPVARPSTGPGYFDEILGAQAHPDG